MLTDPIRCMTNSKTLFKLRKSNALRLQRVQPNSQLSCRLHSSSSKVYQRNRAGVSPLSRQVTSHAAHLTPLVEPLVAATGLPIASICHVAATCIIAGACIRNVPQLIQCWKQHTTEGISLWALVTEVSCYAASVSYGSRRGYPCTMWGSDMACWLQDSVLIGMIAAMRGFPKLQTGALIAGWLAVQAMLFTSAVPMWALAKFQIVAGLILGLGARVPQIMLNFRQGHTGVLNPATPLFNATSNAVMGTIALIMTGDLYVIGTQIWMFVLNTIVLGQILASRRSSAQAAADKGVRRLSYDDEEGTGERARLGYA